MCQSLTKQVRGRAGLSAWHQCPWSWIPCNPYKTRWVCSGVCIFIEHGWVTNIFGLTDTVYQFFLLLTHQQLLSSLLYSDLHSFSIQSLRHECMSPYIILHFLPLIIKPLSCNWTCGCQLETACLATRCDQRHVSGHAEDNFQEWPGCAFLPHLPPPFLWQRTQILGPWSINSDQKHEDDTLGWQDKKSGSLWLHTCTHCHRRVKQLSNLSHCYLFY